MPQTTFPTIRRLKSTASSDASTEDRGKVVYLFTSPNRGVCLSHHKPEEIGEWSGSLVHVDDVTTWEHCSITIES